jgi:integrase/recombinase XerD
MTLYSANSVSYAWRLVMEDTDLFIKERKYLMNVTPATVDFYNNAFKSVSKFGDFSEDGLKRWVIGARDSGVSPRSINTWTTGINAYLKWKGEVYRVKKLKCTNRVLPIYSGEHLEKLLKWKPESPNERRLQLLVLLILDTGVRINEATTLKWESVDFDNCIIKVRGKGDKERLVPFSSELRKKLWLYSKNGTSPLQLVFETREGTGFMRRNARRDLCLLCRRLGFPAPPRAVHALRHTFAVNFLKGGGNLYYLARILGHASVKTTEGYLKSVAMDDLQKASERVSILNRR